MSRAKLGHIVPRECEGVCSTTNRHHPRRRVIQYSRDANDESRSRSVLDTRFRGYDDFFWSGSLHHSCVLACAETTLRENDDGRPYLRSSRIIAAPFSAIIAVGVLVFPEVIVGITDASATRSPAMP